MDLAVEPEVSSASWRRLIEPYGQRREVADTNAPVWSVAIFAARESILDLEPTIVAAINASTSDTVIDLLVNGNRSLADRVVELLASDKFIARAMHVSLRVWFIELGDKSHAWNQYLEFIWPGSEYAFYIDGYVRVRPDALQLLAQGLAGSPEYLAGTGVPTVGRNAQALREQMLAQGGIHGNLFALKRATTRKLRDIGFKLPLGLYRTDPTLGAALAFSLDPARSRWDLKGRILVHPNVTWSTEERSIWNLADLSSQIKRAFRQGQGTLENLAVRDFFAARKLSPEKLPKTAALLISQWAAARPLQLATALVRNPLAGLALRRLRSARDWSAVAVPPVQCLPKPISLTAAASGHLGK